MKRKSFLPSLALFGGLVALILGGSVVAQGVEYIEGETPYFEMEVAEAGYGGLTGVLGANGLTEKGNFEFNVVYPQGFDSPSALDVVDSNGGRQGDSVVFRTSDPCVEGEGSELTCGYIWYAHNNFNDIFDVPGVYKIKTFEGATVVDASDPNSAVDYLEITVNGELTDPVAQFESTPTTITDPTQQTQTISVLARSPSGVEKVEFDLDGETVTVANGVTVPESAAIGADTYRFSYDWDVASLDVGRKIVRAKVFSDNGKTVDAHASDSQAAFLPIVIATTVNEKLQAQCEENKTAVVALIDSINDDAEAQRNTLDSAKSALRAYRIEQGIETPELLAIEEELIEVTEIAYFNSIEDLLGYSTIECAGSLSDDINLYKAGFENYREKSAAYTDQLVQYAETILGEVTNG